jgi:hypothetical protein
MPCGSIIFLRIIIFKKVRLLLIVMDLRMCSSPNTMLVMILNVKLIMLLSLE